MYLAANRMSYVVSFLNFIKVLKVRIRTASILLSIYLLASTTSLPAPYVWKNGWFHDQKYVATESLEEHWKQGLQALASSKWDEALAQFRIVNLSFPDSSQAKEAHYYIGVALYNLDDFDIANKEFSQYLEVENNPQFYEEVFNYKLLIAQKLKAGALRHPFGYQSMPKIMPGKDLALEIFEEVATALPNHDLAATALQDKAEMLLEREEFDQAIDTYQTLIRRFPKSQFAINGYLGIAKAYLKQIELEGNNPDPLPLAELNLQKFQADFPQESTIESASGTLKQMQEIAANGLFNIGQFYERTKRPSASIIYYNMAITKFPDTEVAKLCKERLKELEKDAQTPS